MPDSPIKFKKKRLVIKETIAPVQAEMLDAPRKRWNEEFIDVLGRLTKLLAAQGEVFKSRAYKKAEETVRAIDEDIVEVSQLKGKPGIGATILEKLQEYVNTGTLQLLEREKGKPEYLFAEIHGVGPKKAKELVEKGVTTLAQLRERQDELLNEVQKKGLKYYEDIQLKIPRAEIDEYKEIFDKAFDKAINGSDAKLEVVGSYRRGAKESGDIDVIVTASDPQMFPNFTKELESTNTILETLSCGKTKCLVIAKLPGHKYARRVDFMYTSPEEYPFAVLYFTGSKTFNTVMRGNALKLGFSLNEHGLYTKKAGKEKEEKVEHLFKDERDIFTFLNMKYREPVERNEGTVLPMENKKDIVEEVKEVKEKSPIKKTRGRPKKIREGSPLTKKNREPKGDSMKEIKEGEGEPAQPIKQTKKRGRPPKEKGSPQNVTVKKRGRPPKKAAEITLIPAVFPDEVKSSPSKKEGPEIVPVIPLEKESKEEAKLDVGSPTKEVAKLDVGSPAKEEREGSQGNRRFPAKKEIKTTDDKPLRKMSNKTAIKKLITLFKKDGIRVLDPLPEKDIEAMVIVANDAYYNSKNPLLTDNEYDIVREYAEKKYPENVTIREVGAPITKNKVTLPYNMPSMDKIKPDTNALANWNQKYKGPYVLSCKLDGVSGLYTTEGPEPKLYTRGDGTVGQDVSHLIKPLKLPPKPEGEKGSAVRGEFILPKKVFDEKYKAQFANPRNLVSGIVNSKTIDDKTRDLHFVTYEVINPPLKVGEQMDRLKALGHEVVQNKRVDALTNDMLSEVLLDWRSHYEYEIDGVIVADDNLHPRKDGNPEYAFAFKMVISDQMAEAKVVDVLWEASKSGYLKPRVQIEPIKLGGVTIQYATGFNADFIEKNKIGVGAVIQIIRSGDVIPYIKAVTSPAEHPKMPNQTYVWTKNHVDIVLEDVEGDVTVKRKNITDFFTKLEVDGLSGKTVEKIMDTGADTVAKILKMTKADFAKVKGFKETLVNKIHDGIKTQVEKASLLDIMVASNAFGRGIGERKIKPIMEAEPDILTEPGTVQEKYDKLLKIKGIGQENAQSFTQNIDRFLAFLRECGLEEKLVAEKVEVEAKVVDVSHPLYGKRIVMSGVRDATIKEKTESVGGIVDDNVGSKTFVLIVKSKGEKETSKMKYAREHQIDIMEPSEFLAKYFA